ncbi:MAG: hypothetical protein FWD52_01855, partial [Candidatus Bathyarchaeota archaeon]|nr:hypothetical protein [Candidatus Termiticorpusculum sp.]
VEVAVDVEGYSVDAVEKSLVLVEDESLNVITFWYTVDVPVECKCSKCEECNGCLAGDDCCDGVDCTPCDCDDVPVLLANVYDLGGFFRVWLSYPVVMENVVATMDGNPVEFDGAILEGAKTWVSGVGYTGEYSYVDAVKTNDWQQIVLTVRANGQTIVVTLTNNQYVPPVEWVTTFVDPTCTLEGYTELWHVPTGGKWYSNYVPALGHDFTVLYREGDHLRVLCSVCGWEGYIYEPEVKPDVTVVSVSPTAVVKQLNGNKNDLTITITEKLSDGTTNVISQTFSINNNAANTYTVGSYNVYVDTKGNTQIRACYIV